MSDSGGSASAGPSTEEEEADCGFIIGRQQSVAVHYQDGSNTFSLRPNLPENEKDPSFVQSTLQVTEIYKYTWRSNLAYTKKKTTESVMR